MSPVAYMAGERRLSILRDLIADGGHGSEATIEMALRAQGYHAGLTREDVRANLRFLDSAGAITLDYYRETLMVAHITARGVAIGEGRIAIEGVARPPLGG